MAQRGVEKYLSIKPDDARAYYLLGEICRQRREGGDTGKAKGHYRRAISIDPLYPSPQKGIGLIYYKQGERALARKHLKLYLSLLPHASDRAYIEDYIGQLQ